jgi:hypothetical protein
MTRLTEIRDEVARRHLRSPEGGFDGTDAAIASAIEDFYETAMGLEIGPDLRTALETFVTGEGAMATDPDGDCYFCEAEGVDFELPFHPGADPDHAGEHWPFCLVPIARAAIDWHPG